MAGSNSTEARDELWQVAEAWQAIATSQSDVGHSVYGTVFVTLAGVLAGALIAIAVRKLRRGN